MIGFVAAFLLAAGGHQGQIPGILGQGGSIEVPPPIDEQVRPYRTCLVEQFERNPQIRSGGAEGMRAATSQPVAACAGARRTAAAAADAVLRSRKGYRNAIKRRASIETVLGNLDAGLLPLYLAVTPAPPPHSELTDAQAAIVYDQCLARAAARASRTDAADTAIFGIARAECAGQRTGLLRASDPERARIFDAIEAGKEAGFPEATRKVREQRRAFEARSGTPK